MQGSKKVESRSRNKNLLVDWDLGSY